MLLSIVTLGMGFATGILLAGNKRLRNLAILVLVLGTGLIFGFEYLIALATNDYSQWLLRGFGFMLLGPAISTIAGLYLRRHDPQHPHRKVK